MNCDDEIVKRKLYYDGLKQVINDPIPKKQAKDVNEGPTRRQELHCDASHGLRKVSVGIRRRKPDGCFTIGKNMRKR